MDINVMTIVLKNGQHLNDKNARALHVLNRGRHVDRLLSIRSTRNWKLTEVSVSHCWSTCHEKPTQFIVHMHVWKSSICSGIVWLFDVLSVSSTGALYWYSSSLVRASWSLRFTQREIMGVNVSDARWCDQYFDEVYFGTPHTSYGS